MQTTVCYLSYNSYHGKQQKNNARDDEPANQAAIDSLIMAYDLSVELILEDLRVGVSKALTALRAQRQHIITLELACSIKFIKQTTGNIIAQAANGEVPTRITQLRELRLRMIGGATIHEDEIEEMNNN